MLWLQSQLETQFGKLSRQENAFRHFGVDITRCESTKNIEISQRQYLDGLKPIVVEKKRGDGRLVSTAANSKEITEYRSLVSALAWLGVTHPGAQAAASLFQHALPVPLLADVDRVNQCLAQLKSEYVPVVFRSGMML